MWGNDNLAILMEGLSKSRVRVTHTFNPASPQASLKKLWELNSDDRYSNPGFPMTVPMHGEGQYCLLPTRAGACFSRDPEPHRRATGRLLTNMT
jgi:hypothetical protein